MEDIKTPKFEKMYTIKYNGKKYHCIGYGGGRLLQTKAYGEITFWQFKSLKPYKNTEPIGFATVYFVTDIGFKILNKG